MGLFDKIKKVISKIIGFDSIEPPKVKRGTRKSYNATHRNKTNEKIPKDLGKKKLVSRELIQKRRLSQLHLKKRLKERKSSFPQN